MEGTASLTAAYLFPISVIGMTLAFPLFKGKNKLFCLFLLRMTEVIPSRTIPYLKTNTTVLLSFLLLDKKCWETDNERLEGNVTSAWEFIFFPSALIKSK